MHATRVPDAEADNRVAPVPVRETAARIARRACACACAYARPSIAPRIDVSPRAKPRKYRARCDRAQPFESLGQAECNS